MTYRIQGARGFTTTSESAERALVLARAASRQFPPITIIGPNGELSVTQLQANVERERARLVVAR